MHILVKRTGAFGDVLLITPIVHRLALENPDAVIDVETASSNVFRGPHWNNPEVTGIFHSGAAPRDYDRIIDLDGVYEKDRSIHQVDACLDAAFGDRHGDKTTRFPFQGYAELPLELERLDWSRVIAVHANTSWRNRTIPADIWIAVGRRLQDAGWRLVLMGTHIDQRFPVDYDTVGKIDLAQQAAVISRARAFVGGCCGLLCLASATETPLVTFLTILKPSTGLFHRHGELGWNMAWTEAAVDCFGCAEEYHDATFIGCRRKDYACMSEFDVTEMVETVLRAIRDDRRT